MINLICALVFRRNTALPKVSRWVHAYAAGVRRRVSRGDTSPPPLKFTYSINKLIWFTKVLLELGNDDIGKVSNGDGNISDELF